MGSDRRARWALPTCSMNLFSEHAYPLCRAEYEYAFACDELEREIETVNDISRRQTLSWSDHGQGFRRVFRYHAKNRVPRVIETVFRKDLSVVTQVMEYDRRSHRGWYDITSALLGKRFFYRVEFSIDEPEPGQSLHRTELVMQVRLPLVGRRVERQVKEEMDRREEAEVAATRRFLQETWPAIKDRVMAQWPKGPG